MEYTLTNYDKLSLAAGGAILGTWAVAVIKTRKATKNLENHIADRDEIDRNLNEQLNKIV